MNSRNLKDRRNFESIGRDVAHQHDIEIKKPPSHATVVSVFEPKIEESYFFSATTLVNLPFSKASLPKTAST
jgi:hypothetical protein